MPLCRQKSCRNSDAQIKAPPIVVSIGAVAFMVAAGCSDSGSPTKPAESGQDPIAGSLNLEYTREPSGTWPERYSRLLNHCGVDIRTLGDAQRSEVESLVQGLTNGFEHRPPPWGGATWYVWRPVSGDAFLIVLQGRRLTKSPGSSRVRVLVLNRNDTLLTWDECSFWDADIGIIDFGHHASGFPYIRLQLEYSWQACYAVVDGQLHLVRVEDDQGRVLPWLGFGRENDRLPAREWLQRLGSSDRFICLKTLATLLVHPAEIIGDAAVERRLLDLSQSDDLWTSEGASSYLEILRNPGDFSWILDEY